MRLVCALFLALALAACRSPPPEQPTAPPTKKPTSPIHPVAGHESNAGSSSTTPGTAPPERRVDTAPR